MKIAKLVLIVLVLAAIIQVSTWVVGYFPNKCFIETNETLPFKYQILKGYGEWVWWSWMYSAFGAVIVVVCVLCRKEVR